MIEQPTFEASIYDYISVNGRISKKLFEKVVIPKLKKLNQVEAENKRLREVLETISETDLTDGAPDVLWLSNWRNETKRRAREVLNKEKE
jgi:hypothetical protein